MLVSCPVVSGFWKVFLDWYETHTSTKLELSTVKILYGIIDNDRLNKLTNHILLLVKYHIYCCSINEQPLSLSVYQTILSEKQSWNRKNKYQQVTIHLNLTITNGNLWLTRIFFTNTSNEDFSDPFLYSVGCKVKFCNLLL